MRHVLNFKAQFADLVASGEKRQTIRAPRKRPIAVGDELRLYTGMRTKACRLLGTATCELTRPLTIDEHGTLAIEILGHFYAQDDFDRDTFAQLDGFSDGEALVAWFDRVHGLPFEGVVIRWGALR